MFNRKNYNFYDDDGMRAGSKIESLGHVSRTMVQFKSSPERGNASSSVFLLSTERLFPSFTLPI
jgi:hypothetical protein